MESTRQNTNIKALKEIRKLFNDVKNNLSNEETKRIIKELYKKEVVYNFLKEKEQEDSLTNKQKKVSKNTGRYLKKLNNDLKNYKNIKIILHMA